MKLDWKKSERNRRTVTFPGKLRISASVLKTEESIIGTVTVAGCVVKKWAVPKAVGTERDQEAFESLKPADQRAVLEKRGKVYYAEKNRDFREAIRREEERLGHQD